MQQCEQHRHKGRPEQRWHPWCGTRCICPKVRRRFRFAVREKFREKSQLPGLSTGMLPAQLMLPPARFSIVQNVRATDALAHRRAWRRIPIASSRCRQRQRRACDILCGASSGPCTSSQLCRAAASAPCNASSWSREPRHPWIFFGKARLSSQGLLFRPEASLHSGNFD